MPASTSKVPVRSLYKTLYHHFGPQNWWPADTSWEMMVGAFLTQNTAWTNVEKALANLKADKALSVEKMATMPRRRLEQLIRPSGYFRQKAKRLQLFARAYKKDSSLIRDRRRLLDQHGVGPETADSILLYAAGLPYFVVDAYTRRIGQRMGLFKMDDYHEVQDFFHRHLTPDSALYNEFHALLVRLAKEFCTSRKPACIQCPVGKNCAYARRLT